MITCPHCGAELKPGATFCRHCGSNKDTGWKEGAEFADEELPDYEEILENEFGKKKSGKAANIIGAIVAIIIALAFIAATAWH